MALSLARTKSDDRIRARDPRTARTELIALATHRSAEVRAAVASRPDCPLGTQLSLVLDDDVRVLEALVSNPAAPASVLAQLASHKREPIRALAAQRLLGVSQPV